MKKLPDFLMGKGPVFVCAPMVDQSELAFRLLTRRHGCHLAYTPMLHAKMMVTHKKYLPENFTTCEDDRPLVAQLCGDDPELLVKAAKLIEDRVDAIDLNFGCPQAIAKRGHYGAYLLEEEELIFKIVRALKASLRVPVFCKMRVLPSEERTIELAKGMEAAGCSLLTVHGRTKEMNKERVGACDWSIIRKINDSVGIPVLANGGIFNLADVRNCLQETEAFGVMSAEGLLQNPALFSQEQKDLDLLAKQYIQLAKAHSAPISAVRGHLFKMLFRGLNENEDLRAQMASRLDLAGFEKVVDELRQRRKDKGFEEKFGWYKRYWGRQPKQQKQPKQQQQKKQARAEKQQ